MRPAANAVLTLLIDRLAGQADPPNNPYGAM